MKGDCIAARAGVELELACGEAEDRVHLVLGKIMAEAEARMLKRLQQFSIADLV